MKYPGVQAESTLEKFRDVIRTAQRLAREGLPVELEIRQGKVNVQDNRFEPGGLSVEELDRIDEGLSRCRDWASKSNDWCISNVFHHRSSIPGDTRMLRSVATYPSATQKRIETVDKVGVCKATYGVSLDDSEGCTKPVDFRVALAVEHPVPPEDVPGGDEPTRCTIRLRKEYLYTPKGCTNPAYRFHLTKRWTDTSYVGALYAMNTRPPMCDIEMEVDAEYIITRGEDEVMFKMLWKVNNLISAILNRNIDPEEYTCRQAF